MRPSPSLACARQTMNVPLDKRPSWHWYRRASAQSHHLEDQEFSGFRTRNQGEKKHTHSHLLPGIFFGVARTEGSPVVASHSPTLNPPLMPIQRAFHGGSRRLRAWHSMGREEVKYEGSLY